MIDRRLIQNFDWGLLCLTAVLALIGLMTLYSAAMANPLHPQKTLFVRQTAWFGIGLFFLIVLLFFNYKLFERHAYTLYAGSIILLILVLLWGKHVSGAQRWLAVGGFSIQPSELAKIAVTIVLARYYARRMSDRGLVLRELLIPMGLLALPFVLIVKQPDLGTAILLALIAGTMTVFVKVERRTLWLVTACGVTAVPVVWQFLKGYQKQRILTLLNPDGDPLGAGYHIIQSKIAIGSGMFAGKGYLNGTQNALSFLPEQHTDFIFSVLAEEWGFLGSVLTLLLFAILILWALNIAYGNRDAFGAILAVGIAIRIFWEVFINIGMVMGLMPVVGVPLPFISYGGSSIVTTMICIGFLINIRMRRFMQSH